MPAGDRFCEVPRAAFEAFFAEANAKLEAAGRELRWRPCELFGELTFDIEVAREAAGLVKMVVYTSVPWGSGTVQRCGKDAIRVVLVFCGPDGKRDGITTETKVLRTGTVAGVLGRTRERMADAWRQGKSLRHCGRCRAPAYWDSGRCVVRLCRMQGGRAEA